MVFWTQLRGCRTRKTRALETFGVSDDEHSKLLRGRPGARNGVAETRFGLRDRPQLADPKTDFGGPTEVTSE